MGYKCRWDAQACEVGGESLPKGKRQSRKKEWSSWRVHYKLLSPEAALGCPQEKQQLCLELCSSFPASPAKNGERKKIHISYKENTMWQRRTKLCHRVSIIFTFSHFCHWFVLANIVFVGVCSTKPLYSFWSTFKRSHSSEMLDQSKDQSCACSEI